MNIDLTDTELMLLDGQCEPDTQTAVDGFTAVPVSDGEKD